MKINIIAIGNRMPAWVQQAYLDYSKRFSSEYNLQLIEIPPEKNTNQNTSVLMEREGNKILAAIKERSHTIALDIQGQRLDTQQFAQKFEFWTQNFQTINFVIGGPQGLSASMLQNSNERVIFHF